MKSPLEILPRHEQKHKNSCVAMGLELILKMHEKVKLDAYPLQSGIEPKTKLDSRQWGFGEKERNFLKSEYGVEVRKPLEILDTYDKFLMLINDELERGSFPIFTFPNVATIGTNHPSLHTWIAVKGLSGPEYRTRGYGSLEIFDDIKVEEGLISLKLKPGQDYSIDCLLHG